ncbi:MAG TPA: trypsin-like peptidase domain-containing protein [Pirellulales bacterium]|nr:trypsin-like peptidase domain-containing protein [Pirellulales bacterium]
MGIETERRRDGETERRDGTLRRARYRSLPVWPLAVASLVTSLPPSLLLSLSLSLFFAFASPGIAQDDRAPSAADDAQAAADLELVSAVERVMSRAIARAERSVVSVARRKRMPSSQFLADTHPGMGRGIGGQSELNYAPSEFSTGVVIDAAGLVLTNSHVLGEDPKENDYFITTIERKTFEMKVKASDATSDLAVLEMFSPNLRRPGDFVPIEFGDAAKLKKGQIVIALGNPYGIARDGQASASWGIVANLSRKAPAAGEDDLQKTLHEFGTLIQTDARLNLGTSGGALVNKRGEMVGLTTSLAAVAGFEQAAGYAIPVDKAFRRIIQVLKEGREVEYGMLGITLPSTLPRDRTGSHTHGVVITGVIDGGPAWKANLRPDDVITHVDGKPIYDFDGLRLQVSRFPPETTVTLTVLRPGQSTRFDRRVVLGKLPLSLPQTFTEKPPAWRGATIDYRRPTTRLVGPFLVPNVDESTAPCVAVREIAEGSPAWKAGLRQGTLITHVGTLPVEKPSDFYKAVASQTAEVKLRLLGPDGGKSTVTVPAE